MEPYCRVAILQAMTAAQHHDESSCPEASTRKPEWAPDHAGHEFASFVMKGVEGGHDGMPGQESAAHLVQAPRKRRHLEFQDYVDGILSGDRTILSRAITLVESVHPTHQELAQRLIQELLPRTGNALRVGITGVPGAGKSTTIEALGCFLVRERGAKLAVLAVDPSSTITRGSILGDKTRMENLGREPNAYIRPSPSSGTLGGVARKTRETMLLCEAYGFDTILVETVGVGQSETAVRRMTDFFMLLQIAGAGDELQGIKKGVVELADCVVVNKADGDNLQRARLARSEYERALHYLAPATEGWSTRALNASALTGEGIPELWEMVLEFSAQCKGNGVFQRRRAEQNVGWMHDLVEELLREKFLAFPGIRERYETLEVEVGRGEHSPTLAAIELLKAFQAS